MAIGHFINSHNSSRVKGTILLYSSFSVKARINDFGIHMIPSTLSKQLFGKNHETSNRTISQQLLKELARLHLDLHEIPWEASISHYETDQSLLETEKALKSCKLPFIKGNIVEHFKSISWDLSSSWLKRANSLASITLPEIPKIFDSQEPEILPLAGWTRYDSKTGNSCSVPYPSPYEDLFFDIEMCPRISKHAIMAVAASSKAWYFWRSPMLDDLKDIPSSDCLIPLGTDHLVIGHNVSFDRARVLEEYLFQATNNVNYLDTMALHCAISGLSNQQRTLWLKYRKLLKEYEKGSLFDLDYEEEDDLSKKVLDDFNEEDQVVFEGLTDLNSFSDIKTYAESSLGRWLHQSASNSLVEAAAFHCKIPVASKEDRKFLLKVVDFSELKPKWYQLLLYCANDVLLTHKLYKEIWPKFLLYNPHPATFSSLLIMGKMILPSNHGWYSWISECESQLANFSKRIETSLHDLAQELIDKYANNDAWKHDPWLKHLDWTPVASKYCLLPKPKKPRKIKSTDSGIDPNDNSINPPVDSDTNLHINDNEDSKDIREYDYARPIGNSLFFGKPIWYKRLWDSSRKSVIISPRMTVVPYLLGLTWKDQPVHHLGIGHGWSYLQADESYLPIPSPDGQKGISNSGLPDSIPSVGLIISKGFFQHFRKGHIKATRRPDLAEMAFTSCTEFSFWTSYRSRVSEVLALEVQQEKKNNKSILAILPQMCTMGTITRRATDRLWLTSTSSAKSSVLGSDLKNRIVAPEGWKFVGADVDSQELWISAAFGDAQFGQHGATALSWMGIAGNKANGTDLHSKTAALLGDGATRDMAKIFNYARFYGSGVKFASSLFHSIQPNLSKSECDEKAANLYRKTKGKLIQENSSLLAGGSESFMFNSLAALALGSNFSLSQSTQHCLNGEEKGEKEIREHKKKKEKEQNEDMPRTPVLKCRITDALSPWNVGEGSQFSTTRMNWVVQSSAVDYLHLLLAAMVWLCKRYGIMARLAITIHDEIRWLVKEEHTIRAAIALQIANLWTRGAFSEALGMPDLPLSVAFFSSVEIDCVLRKDPKSPCISPTQQIPIPPGLSFTFAELVNERRKELGITTSDKSLSDTDLLGDYIIKSDDDDINMENDYIFHNNLAVEKTNTSSFPAFIPGLPSKRILAIMAQEIYTSHPEYDFKVSPFLNKKRSTQCKEMKKVEMDEFGDVIKKKKETKN